MDSSVSLDESDFEIMDFMKKKKSIVLLNKTDLEPIVSEETLMEYLLNNIGEAAENLPIIKTSTKENIGIDIFEEQIKNMFFHKEISFNDEVYITNLRHKEALMDAKKSLSMVEKSIEDDMPEDFLSIDLMSAYASLGTIIGEEVGEDLVNEIFSKFCMGK